MDTTDPRSVATTTALGILPWLGGYAATYLLVAPNLRDSPLNQIIEVLEGDAAVHELVGWVFYNAHLVDTVVELPVIGSQTTTYIGGEDGFSLLLYLVPVVLLLAAGFLFARREETAGMTPGAKAGMLVVPGYLLATLLGAIIVEINVSGATGGPDLTSAVILAGLCYPVSLAGTGGALWGLLADRTE